jgi:hypothetical protein
VHDARPVPIDVHTGWIDYSRALRHYASERIRSLLGEFAPMIRSVTVRISDAEPRKPAQRRCDIEVATTHAGTFSASSSGVILFSLVDRTVDAAAAMLRERAGASPYNDLQRIA